jgi:uncharacterized protein (DUF362 family)
MVAADVELSITPLAAVIEFIEFIRTFYKRKIIIVDKSVHGTAKSGFKKHGFNKYADNKENVELLDLSDDDVYYHEVKYSKGKLKLPFSKTMCKAPFIVSIVRPKVHNYVVVTLGIKNVLVGSIRASHEERFQIHQGKEIHSILCKLANIVYPDFVLIDGKIGMEGEGPVDGTERKAGWVVASDDPLTADSVANQLMGFKLNDIGYFNLLRQKRFGLVYPKDKKDIKTYGDYDLNKITPFKPHPNFDSIKEWK